jgi:HD superfamily phosphohydrolase
MLDRLARLEGVAMEPEDRTVTLAAALIHDVGHGPFSHTFETITGEKHTDRTVEAVLAADTEVANLLHSTGVHYMPLRVARHIKIDAGDDPPAGEDSAAAVDPPRWLVAVVDSQLDADRFDFLRRDAAATGVNFGTYDPDWLIEHLRVDRNHDRLYLSAKALSAVEQYVFARYHMYRSVYFHKTVRAAEVMLRLALKRYRNLLRQSDGKTDQQQAVVPDAPPEVRRAFAGEKLSLGTYLELDDDSISGFLKACDRDDTVDTTLRRLADGLIGRRLYKAVDITALAGNKPQNLPDFSDAARAALREAEHDPDYSFAKDAPADTPYKPFDPDEDNPETQIYVEDDGGRQRMLTALSKPVDELTEKYTLLRYHVPEDAREKIKAVAESTFK